MFVKKPPMGWNTWNTFGEKIDEKMVLESADAIVEKGYKDAGYEYVIIDDCWLLRERQDGLLVPDPKKFPHGMKYIADYVHSKGLKFGMYSCAGIYTCAGYPSSYGHEYSDAKQFAAWGVDYLKYDFCNFPKSGDGKNAYLTMAMALKNCGRDILFAACNWGVDDPAKWMRSHGADTYRSTGDINDSKKSYTDIFKGQQCNLESSAPGCFNDMDMLVVGMHGVGLVGVKGCTDEEYAEHFAMWAFCGSPLIMGCDIRNASDEARKIMQNKGLIAINQDEECRPPICIANGSNNILFRILDGGKFAIGVFNTDSVVECRKKFTVSFDDIGIHAGSGKAVKVTDAYTGEDLGIHSDGIRLRIDDGEFKVLVGELIDA